LGGGRSTHTPQQTLRHLLPSFGLFRYTTMSFIHDEECITFIEGNAELTQHENELSRKPQEAYNVSTWLLYLDAVDDLLSSNVTTATIAGTDGKDQDDANTVWHVRDFIGRRAVLALPRSYKLWKNHWEFVVLAEKKQIFDTETVVACWERCLWTLSHFPRVWIDYLSYLKDHPGCISVTEMRRTINRSLQALPVTQHDKIWPVILAWVHAPDEVDPDTNLLPVWQIPMETRIRLLRRFTIFHPLYRHEFGDFLVKHERWGEAAVQYQALLNEVGEAQRDEYWQSFSTVCTQHPVQVEQAGVPWEDIVRAVLKNDSATGASAAPTLGQDGLLEGILWTQLADSWIRRGSFDLARSVYEEGLQKVRTVRDFSLLYDAYLQFEEGLLQVVTDALEEEGDDEDEENEEGTSNEDGDWDILLEGTTTSKLADLELAMARAEHLTSRRPLLLNAVMLRQNPHNVGEWLTRSELYSKLDQPGQSTAVLEEALKTVNAASATNGRPYQLVVQLGKLYEAKDVEQARELLNRICRKHEYHFVKSDDLAECWAFWIEMELRQEAWEEALSLARQAVAPGSGTKKLNLTRALRLWDLLFDLEESLGTVQSTKDAYNRSLDIKTATVQHVMNFAAFLTDHKYFEESFTVYERGIEMFAFPHPGAKILWKSYLTAFLDRYPGNKVERTRDLFERCLELCPAEEAAEFFLMNGEFEEKFGLTRRSLMVYRAMCRKVLPEDQLAAYQLFIAKTTKHLGIMATREIYQDAVDKLKEKDSAKICVDFAKMETALQEYERARAIFAYGAQMADPRRLPEYYKAWHEFEIDNGNEETFREMLRIKRSVEAAFSTINYNAQGLSETAEKLTDEEAMKMIASREGVDVEANAQQKTHQFVPASKRTPAAASLEDVEERVAKIRKIAGENAEAVPPLTDNIDEVQDDDEIDLDEIDAEIEAAANEGLTLQTQSDTKSSNVQDISTKAVPAAVFGGLAAQAKASS
jgi:pre-mRNA-splicing factor SYF1